jgi:NAD(P)H-dependent FMN reductase
MRILTISGSLQAESANGRLLELAEQASTTAGLVIERSISIAEVPHFNPDLEPGSTPAAVTTLRTQLAGVDAVLIATPEYAHSLPGALKNALDWIVGSGELYDKPVAIVCASPATHRGENGRRALEQTLRAHGSKVVLSRSITPAGAPDDVIAVLAVLTAPASPG